MNILAFFAHPDDETMLAGGTLALLAEAGAQVHYLCATRGEGGETGEPSVCAPEKLGDVREQELVCAVQALGGSSLTFLGYTDPPIGSNDELRAFTENLTFLAGQVAASIRQYYPIALITHGSGGEYGHPAHRLCFQAALTAVLSLANAPTLYTVMASFAEHPRPRLLNPDDVAHLIIDTSPVLEKKVQAAMCHRTQHALFTRRSSQEVGRQLTVPEAVQRLHLESLHRRHPPATFPLQDPLSELLTSTGHAHPYPTNNPSR